MYIDKADQGRFKKPEQIFVKADIDNADVIDMADIDEADIRQGIYYISRQISDKADMNIKADRQGKYKY